MSDFPIAAATDAKRRPGFPFGIGFGAQPNRSRNADWVLVFAEAMAWQAEQWLMSLKAAGRGACPTSSSVFVLHCNRASTYTSRRDSQPTTSPFGVRRDMHNTQSDRGGLM
jgi:hypothetical protein